MLVLDASAIIHAWDNYPPQLFPPLWDWIEDQIAREQLLISVVALDEVGHKAPDCFAWLQEKNIKKLPISNAELHAARAIKDALGIVDDAFSPKGVDENDLLIIAVAMTNGAGLVSNEAKQNNLPVNMKQYKIPAVCALPVAGVQCMDFLEYIKGSGAVFK